MLLWRGEMYVCVFDGDRCSAFYFRVKRFVCDLRVRRLRGSETEMSLFRSCKNIIGSIKKSCQSKTAVDVADNSLRNISLCDVGIYKAALSSLVGLGGRI